MESMVGTDVPVPPAGIRRWVPPYIDPGKPDLYYINEILSKMWCEPDGSMPRLGNPEAPLDDLIYLMLTRRGRIDEAQRVFESLCAALTDNGQGRPEWGRLIDLGVDWTASHLNSLGMGRTRAREIHAVLKQIRGRFGEVTLDPLRKWNKTLCLSFLCSLHGVSLKTAACVMLYTLGRKVFPADTHCIRVLARLGVLPPKYESQKHHKAAQQLLMDGRISGKMALSLHVSLVLHGQAVCTRKIPKCHACPVRGFCADFRRKASERWREQHNRPSCADLFSGAGGTSIGLSRPIEWGHDPRAKTTPTLRIALAAELDQWAHKTYATNHPEIPEQRVLRVDLTTPAATDAVVNALCTEPNLVLIVGGPPCQKVSLIGTTGRRMATSRYGRFDQRREAETYIAFREIVKRLRTRFFIMENVPGLFAANDGTARQDIIDDFSGLYSTAHIQVDAYHSGVPQHRKRVLTVGVLRSPNRYVADLALASLLEKLSAPLGHVEWIPTFGEAVSDLPEVAPSMGVEFSRYPGRMYKGKHSSNQQGAYQTAMRNGSRMIFNHVARPNNIRDLKLYELLGPGEIGADAHDKYQRPDLMIYRNDIFLDKYRRQVWDAPSTTIVAHLAKDGHMFIHPRQVRSITVREAARLQSFTDDFIFLGPRTEQFRQVGNAIPPLLGARIRTAVLDILERFYPGESDL